MPKLNQRAEKAIKHECDSDANLKYNPRIIDKRLGKFEIREKF